MPCVRKIESLLRDQIYEKIKPGYSMSVSAAQNLVTNINKGYGYSVVSLSVEDTYNFDISIPQTLIKNFYDNELKLEIRESILAAEKEARTVQIEDAERAGLDYNDNYLFDNSVKNEKFFENQMSKARDNEIATKLGQKFERAFGISYEIITASDAAILLELSPTPYSDNVSAFFYGNKVYFIKDKFNAKSVLHEFAHPLIKGISLQNSKLFNNLFTQLSKSETGRKAIAFVKESYPELEVNSVRFKEEAIVTAMEIDSAQKIENIKSNDSLFERFIQNLLFAIKKVIRALTNVVNLNTLSTSTTVDQLVDMMLNEDFVIENLTYQSSMFAEFQKDTDTFLKDLEKAQPKKIIDSINRFHEQMSFQINELKNSPTKLKEALGSDAAGSLQSIRDYIKGYKTDFNMSENDVNDLLTELENNEQDLKIRSLAFVNSITELKVFANRIKDVFEDIKKNKQYLFEDGNQQIQYFLQFIESQMKLLTDIKRNLNLDASSELSKEINSIQEILEQNKNLANEMTFEYVKDLLLVSGLEMQNNAKETLSKRIDEILGKEKFTDDEINIFKEDLFAKLDVDNIREIKSTDLKLPRIPTTVKYLLQDISKYNETKITEDVVNEYLRGHVRDVNYFGASLNPVANINDLFGGFSSFMKNKIQDAEIKSEQQQELFINSLAPYLDAIGYNPNKTQELANKLLFVDKKGIIKENGEVEEYEAFAYLDKFQNWEYDEALLKGNIKKAELSGDKSAIKDAKIAYKNFERDYMVRKFTDEIYDLQNIWIQDNVILDPVTKKNITISADVSLEAYNERKSALDDLNTFSRSDAFTKIDDLLEFSPSAAAKIKYNNLYNLYDNDGNYKQGVELEKVLVRRFYRQQSRSYYESETDIKKFQKDFTNFVNNELASLGITKDSTPEEYDKQVEKFLNKNTRVAYTDDYYLNKNKILDQINTINAKSKGAEISKKLASLYEQRYNIINRVTDKDGEPNGGELGIVSLKKLKKIEEEIVTYSEQFDKKTGLSKTDAYKLKYYEEKIIGAGKASQMTDTQKAEYASFLQNREAFGLSNEEILILKELYKSLSELNNVSATDYYVEAFNTALGMLDVEPITIQTADSWINSEKLLNAKANNSRFSEWFDNNHFKKTIFNYEVGDVEEIYVRTKAWTISKPSVRKFYKTTELIDPSTGKKIIIDGVPVAKYSNTKIKDQFLTGYDNKTGKVNLEVGVHIDNRKRFLPKEQAIGSQFDKYMNKRYFDLKKSNNVEFKLLEAIKKQRLKNQENSPDSAKLYLDYPRFRIQSNLEYLQSGDVKGDIKGKTAAIVEGLKSTFRKREDDIDTLEANFDSKFLYVPTDLQGKPISKIPVRGLYKMPLKAVSKDVLLSELNYMNSLDIQKVKIEAESSASALLNVLGNPENAIKDLEKASSKLSNAQSKKSVFLKKETNRRLKLAENYINRTFYGENVDEFQQKNPTFSKAVRRLMGGASMAFYSLNPVSTIKNKGGMTFQRLIFAAGGKYINFPSIGRGQIQAMKVLIEYAAKGTYSRGIKSLNMQLMDAFDMAPGKSKKDSGKSHTNSAIKQLFDGAWMYSDRKLTEVQGALELAHGLLDWQMIDQIQPNGKVTQIRYIDAFEVDSKGIAKIKDGINPEYGMNYTDHSVIAGETLESIAKKYYMTVEELAKKNKMLVTDTLEVGKNLIISRNTKFNVMKLRMANANKKLNGTVAAIDSPLAEKYLLYDVLSFSRKFATGMFLSRFQMDTSKGVFSTIKNGGGEVWDWDLNEATKGSYITFLQWTYKMITDFKNYYPLMTNDEKIALKQILMEGMLIALSTIAIMFVFGYDPDDEDRFDKIKAREENYGAVGWLGNHLLYQIVMVRKENTTMIPLPGLGAEEWLNFADTTNLVMGPTLELYLNILKDFGNILFNSDDAVYSQEVGPYSFQQEGEYKLYNRLAKIFGISGKNASPYWALKKNETFTNLR